MQNPQQQQQQPENEDELRIRHLVTQLNACKSEIFQRDRNLKMMDLTRQEIQNIVNADLAQNRHSKMYKSVGKMFLMAEPQQLMKEFTTGAEKEKRNVTVLTVTKEALEKNLFENHQAYLLRQQQQQQEALKAK